MKQILLTLCLTPFALPSWGDGDPMSVVDHKLRV